jgi:Ca-activated chloride channel family protein
MRTLAAESVLISVRSHLVLIPVTVTDRNGKSITDLERRHFQVPDNSEPREIVSFSREDGPVSLGVVLDLSGRKVRVSVTTPFAKSVRVSARTGYYDPE